MGHPVGAFISTNPSTISLAKAHTCSFIGFIWSIAQCHLQYAVFLLRVFLFKHLVDITKGRFVRH